jgi:hypothetical protein
VATTMRDAAREPTLLEYAKVIDWLWTERHNIRPERASGVHMADFPPGLADVFDDALKRVAAAISS